MPSRAEGELPSEDRVRRGRFGFIEIGRFAGLLSDPLDVPSSSNPLSDRHESVCPTPEASPGFPTHFDTFLAFQITKDGVSVAKAITLKDKFENLGARYVAVPLLRSTNSTLRVDFRDKD